MTDMPMARVCGELEAEIKRLRAALQQIKDVCEDNTSAGCNHAMAVNFIWGIADNHLHTEV
jgi:hypothetical protein